MGGNIMGKYGYDLLLGLIAAFYVFTVPFTKVEESFNMQAMHGIIYHRHQLHKYDHLEFSGVVPRTFIGAWVVSVLASPVVSIFGVLGLDKYYSLLVDLGSQGFGDLLACIRDKSIPLQNNIHFVTYRNNLNKILATAYIRNEPWEMGVHKRNGVVYLDVHKLPERPQTERDRQRCYWGYCFEAVATESPRREGERISHVDPNQEFCAVIKTKLGAHRILMGAEMDCHDVTDNGGKYYIELKTSRELDYHTEERFEREKLLKFWIQSFLAGVPFIVIGFRDDLGRLVRIERLRTQEITQRVKMKNYWQGGVCLAFADEVLCWLYGTVRENEDYVLHFAPPFTRLELLKGDSCPDVISFHVEQLQSL